MLDTDRLLLIPLDHDIIDSLLESNQVFQNKYSFINEGGEYLNPSPDYLHIIKNRLAVHPEEYPFAVDYLIIVKNIKTVIGTIYYKYLPNEEGVTEIGYGINPKYEGNGYMCEALTGMLNMGKDNGVIKVVADTSINNIKSQNVLTRCGFSLDKKENDTIWFSKIL